MVIEDNLSKFRIDAESRAKAGICDGNCEDHRGDVIAVRVESDGRDWGWFSYCEEAREIDSSRGMILRSIRDGKYVELQ